MPKRSKLRILAIDPGLEEIGFALFQDRELVRYGVKIVRASKRPGNLFSRGQAILRELILKSIPDVLVLEKPSHELRKTSKVLCDLINHTKALARVHKIKVYEYSPDIARARVFSQRKPTKKHVAELIASYYPELSQYVPVKSRILWRKKDFYWLNVFDACTLALAYLEADKK